MIKMCTSVQSSNGSAAQVYRVAHLGNQLRTPISIGYKIRKHANLMGIGCYKRQRDSF